MRKRTASHRGGGHGAAWLSLMACIAVLLSHAGCGQKAGNEKLPFDDELNIQASAAGETAQVGMPDSSRIGDIFFSRNMLSGDVYRLDEEQRLEFLSILRGATFTRLTDRDARPDDPAITEAVEDIMANGLVFTYSIPGRETVGSVYMAADGRACWFTSSGSGVFAAAAGELDYAAALRLGLYVMYGDRIPDGFFDREPSFVETGAEP